MSNISISVDSMAAMASDMQASSATISSQTAMEASSQVMSGENKGGADGLELVVAGAEVASKSTEFFGAGPDLSSTGTDIDVAQAINTTLIDGQGTITDKVA